MLSLNKFDQLYSSSDNLPLDELLEDYDTQLFELFSSGKLLFFSGLKLDYPEIFDFLMTKCSDLFLSERKATGEFLYSWILASSKNYIKLELPFSYRLNNVDIAERNFYKALPESIKPFYYAIDGFDIDDVPEMSIQDSGFFRSMDNWPYIHESLNNKDSQNSMIEHVKINYPDSDLRIICFGLQEDALVVDVKNLFPGLFQVTNNPIRFELLEKPVDYITDIFFANFPEVKRA